MLKNSLPLILLGVFLNAAAQLLLKAGMEKIGYFKFSLANIIPIGLQVIGNLPILTGLSFYVFSVVVWLMALSRVEVSFAYPMLSLGYIVTAVAGYFCFNENLSLTRVAGIVVIMLGVCLITRTV